MKQSKILPRRGAQPLEPRPVEQLLLVDGPELTGTPMCVTCKGTGQVHGLLQLLDCDKCYGTGFDIRFAVGILRFQKSRLEKAERVFSELSKAVQMSRMTEEQKQQYAEKAHGMAVERFYADSKVNKYD